MSMSSKSAFKRVQLTGDEFARIMRLLTDLLLPFVKPSQVSFSVSAFAEGNSAMRFVNVFTRASLAATVRYNAKKGKGNRIVVTGPVEAIKEALQHSADDLEACFDSVPLMRGSGLKKMADYSICKGFEDEGRPGTYQADRQAKHPAAQEVAAASALQAC